MRNFSVMLPPGWVQFDLTQPVGGQVTVAAKEMLSKLPPPMRGELRRQIEPPLTEALANLASGGAVAAYMSAEDPRTAAIFPIVVVRPADFAVEGEVMDPMDYLVALISTGEVALVDPVGMVGVKHMTDRDVSSSVRRALAQVQDDVLDSMEGLDRESFTELREVARQIEYTIGVPETSDCWMVISAEVTADARENAVEALDAVTEFLDAWVGTIIWNEEGDENE